MPDRRAVARLGVSSTAGDVNEQMGLVRVRGEARISEIFEAETHGIYGVWVYWNP